MHALCQPLHGISCKIIHYSMMCAQQDKERPAALLLALRSEKIAYLRGGVSALYFALNAKKDRFVYSTF